MAEADEMRATLERGGLLSPADAARLTPLAGGVSCDVFKVETASGRVFVAKRALPRLRVAAEWLAPVERAVTEVRWLNFVRTIDPRLAPEVLAECEAEHVFTLRLLDPATHPVWKSEMAAGRVDPAFAAAVGRDLARIHAASAAQPALAAQFRTDAQFLALRVDPFLLHVARRDPVAGPRLRALAADLMGRKIALAQGDISPKNILAGPDGPVFLDAECAVWGDPAFDLAFCLTHLLLKTVWLKPHADALVQSFDALWAGYQPGVDWEPVAELSARAAALVAALLLARIDGKSPAPYLTDEADKACVRDRAYRLLDTQPLDLERLSRFWRTAQRGA